MADPYVQEGRGVSGVTPEDDGLIYARQLMCSPGGRDWIERIVLKPFGYAMCADVVANVSEPSAPDEAA